MSWQRSRETKRRYKNLYKQTKNHYGRGVWYDEERDRFIRFQMSKKGRGNRIAYVKNKCNRKLRRSNTAFGRAKGAYKKHAEFWWEVF